MKTAAQQFINKNLKNADKKFLNEMIEKYLIIDRENLLKIEDVKFKAKLHGIDYKEYIKQQTHFLDELETEINKMLSKLS